MFLDEGPREPMLYEPLLHIVLHQPEIPPNTGNIGRTCVAIGAKLWLVKPLAFDVSEKARRRAGLDYWQHLEWEVVEDWPSLVGRLQRAFDQGRVWLFSKRSTKPYTEVAYQTGDVLVFGSETRGLPDELLTAWPENGLRIPTRAEVRSLNLSAAAAVAAYEAVRQLRASF
jgi:tRNA (cytidine/uridine-2'-O-)-methyltransferase